MTTTVEIMEVIYLGFLPPKKIVCVGYFWPSVSKYCMETVKKCHPFQVYTQKMCTHPTLISPSSLLVLSPSGVLNL